MKKGNIPPIHHIMVVCPFCECDCFHIGNQWVKCFLCKRVFSKNVLNIGNIRQINRQLEELKKLDDLDLGNFLNGGIDL